MLEVVHFIHKAGYSHVIIQQVSLWFLFCCVAGYILVTLTICSQTTLDVVCYCCDTAIQYSAEPIVVPMFAGIWIDPDHVASRRSGSLVGSQDTSPDCRAFTPSNAQSRGAGCRAGNV